MSPIEKAIGLFDGDVAELAKRLKVSAQAVYFWRTGRRKISSAHTCIEIEKLTAGVVRCEDLDPGADWSYLRGTAAGSTSHPTEAANA